jgi:hypothetical protein
VVKPIPPETVIVPDPVDRKSEFTPAVTPSIFPPNDKPEFVVTIVRLLVRMLTLPV